MTVRGNGASGPDRAVPGRVPTLIAIALVSLALVVGAGTAAGLSRPGGYGDGSVGATAAQANVALFQSAGPTAELTVSPNPAHPGEAVTLDASGSSSDAGSVACDFDFEGDGTYEVFNDQDCIVQGNYADVGTYQPTVLVRDAVQETDTASTTLSVVQNQRPDAAFDPSPTTVSTGEAVTFDASASSDPDGEIVAFRWDFDADGTVDAVSSTPVVTHAYDDPGSYAVNLLVEDDDGATDEAVFQSITVTANQPPEAAFVYSPAEPTVDEPVTFDASASRDPDGEITSYRWDFDDDGTIDVTSADPTTTRSFDTTGTYVVTLVVEDDDGATDETVDEVIVVAPPAGGPVARCSATPSSAEPGDPVTLDASNSANAQRAEFDANGDGTYDRSTQGLQITVSYSEPGTYEPRVRVTGPNGQTDVADCGSIDIGQPNKPPVARFDVGPADGERRVTLDATASYDPDGTVVVYRWDFDADGVVDVTTATPVVTHTYPDLGSYTVVLEVEDDDGAVDDTTQPVELQRDGLPFQELLLVLVGLVGGLGLCRGLAWLGPFRRRPPILVPGDGVTDYAAGVVELPAAGETVAVDDLDFEPGLVLLTASNAVVAGDATTQVNGTADGWSYGAAHRTADGDIDQHAVAVADDARQPDEAVAAASADRAVLLATNDGEGRVGGLTARVERTSASGFELAVDGPDPLTTVRASNEPDAPSGGRPVVLYRAFELDRPDDVELGHVAMPAEAGAQSIDLDVPADHVTLTACNRLVALDESGTSDGPLGISVGEVVEPADPRQLVTAGAIEPGAVSATTTAASDRLAVHLPVGESGTRARVTGFEDGLELEYEAVASDDTAAASTGQSLLGGVRRSVPVGRQAGGTPEPGLVTYVAMRATATRPVLGHFALPSPAAEDDLAVDTGFSPGMVEFTVVDLDELGERSSTSSPFAFGRSHGVAVQDVDGAVEQYRLNGAVDPDRPVGAAAERDGPPREALVADAAGAGLAADGGGAAITGRDDVTVTVFRSTGFDVRVTDVSTDGRDPRAGSDKLVCYKAWPRPDR